MFHQKRRWCVAPASGPEDLADKLTQHTWTLCTGFEFQGLLFLNDSTSEDGAQEYALIQRRGTRLSQVESVTFGWMTSDQALSFIRHALDGGITQEFGFGEVDPGRLDTPETHGTCGLCQ